MPIELRRSDVFLAAGEALGRASDAARVKFDIDYEAERVSQVNQQLTYLEQSYQTYNTDIEQRSFTSYPDQTGTIAQGRFDVERPAPVVVMRELAVLLEYSVCVNRIHWALSS